MTFHLATGVGMAMRQKNTRHFWCGCENHVSYMSFSEKAKQQFWCYIRDGPFEKDHDRWDVGNPETLSKIHPLSYSLSQFPGKPHGHIFPSRSLRFPKFSGRRLGYAGNRCTIVLQGSLHPGSIWSLCFLPGLDSWSKTWDFTTWEFIIYIYLHTSSIFKYLTLVLNLRHDDPPKKNKGIWFLRPEAPVRSALPRCDLGSIFWPLSNA